MRFELVDKVLEVSATRIVAVKAVALSEEYLADHFPTFPILPGVLMLEAMVQAARKLAEGAGGGEERPLVLGRVRTLKFGQFVPPGSVLRLEVDLAKREGDSWDFRGQALLEGETPEVAASGRFVLRPAVV